MANFDKHNLLIRLFVFLCVLRSNRVFTTEILSKSKLERCERTTESSNLNCTRKIVINMAVPSGSSGGEASLVAQVVEVEENTTQMKTIRLPPSITIYKSSVYAVYELTYIRDVPYRPTEITVMTRKCEPDADRDVVQGCEQSYSPAGDIIMNTQPTCCPCGNERRQPSSCGNFFENTIKGKPNTAHCLKFPGEWFHVFGMGKRSIGFNIKIEVKTESKNSEVTIGPQNRTATSDDNFLRVNLIGDFAGYDNIPSFEDYYLVIPRQGGEEQQQDLGVDPPEIGKNISMWMLLERVRFTLDSLECNKIGVGRDAFKGQPDFCSVPYGSCLHNQLWNFYESDLNRIDRNLTPLYRVENKYERVNEHPNAGSKTFSIGITEVLNTDLLIELRADDIEYVYQRSPGKICSITTPTFEALSQSGTSTVTVMNTGDAEASYSLTLSCSKGVGEVQEQFFIMKPKEKTTIAFEIYCTTDQAAVNNCTAFLKDSDFMEADNANFQFTTTATVLDNGNQEPEMPKPDTIGFFAPIIEFWTKVWNTIIDYITGKSCRSKCDAFFDIGCQIQYMCMNWTILFSLFLAIFPMVPVLLWFLHQKGLFDPLYDWCGKEDRLQNPHRHNHVPIRHYKHKRDKIHDSHQKHGKIQHRGDHQRHHREHKHQEKGSDYNLHHVQKTMQKHHGHNKQNGHQREERRKYGKGREAMNLRSKLVEEEMDEFFSHKDSHQPNHLRRRE